MRKSFMSCRIRSQSQTESLDEVCKGSFSCSGVHTEATSTTLIAASVGLSSLTSDTLKLLEVAATSIGTDVPIHQ